MVITGPLLRRPRAVLRWPGRLLGFPGRCLLGPSPNPGSSNRRQDPRPWPLGPALYTLALRPCRRLRRHRFPGTWCWSSLFPPLCALSDATGWREASDPHHSCPLWLGCPFYGSLKPGILHGPPRRSPCHVASESQRPTLLLPVGQSWTFPQHETF